jgi:L-aminopeptidase/D-esterase-like protein
MLNAITDVPGIKAGHYTDKEAATGCTVVICEEGAVAGVDVRGSAPGTRETDLLRPSNLVERVHAILLGGGSAFGLDAAGGVMRYLGEKGIGFKTTTACIPIVPAAVLYDLDTGNSQVRPGINEGYTACQVASNKEISEGSVGAGTGATVCKLMGLNHAIKGGIGTASKELPDGIIVATIFAVNALGDIMDHATGETLASPRFPDDKNRTGTIELLQRNYSNDDFVPTNTTIGIVATNASLTKEQVNKIASMAHDGMARAINPSHTMYDGDTIFALSLGDKTGDITTIGAVAAELTAEAIKRAIIHAETLAGVPAIKDIEGGTAC